MANVGLITYHSAYNFGSMLQAYATQLAIEGMGHDCRIIDYRPRQQRHYYLDLVNVHSGFKPFVRSVFLLSSLPARKRRSARYEQFMHDYMKLTDTTYLEVEDVRGADKQFDVLVSGSDQIINKHSNELAAEDWSAMGPYLLSFTDKPKVSYASSPANMTDEELRHIAPELEKFQHLSAREPQSAKKLAEILHKDVVNVLDPTLLIDAAHWSELAKKAHNKLPKQYLVFYSLVGPRPMKSLRPQLQKLAERTKMKMVMITPFAPVKNTSWSVDASDYGPLEFLKAVRGAQSVITNSYHGTLFSLNFGVPFWSISSGTGADLRKDEILHALGLEDRIVSGVGSLSPGTLLTPVDPVAYAPVLSQKREASRSYLVDALNATERD